MGRGKPRHSEVGQSRPVSDRNEARFHLITEAVPKAVCGDAGGCCQPTRRFLHQLRETDPPVDVQDGRPRNHFVEGVGLAKPLLLHDASKLEVQPAVAAFAQASEGMEDGARALHSGK